MNQDYIDWEHTQPLKQERQVMARKKKPKECSNCGCHRKLLITARVMEQADDANYIELIYKRLCLPCLLKSINMTTSKKGEYDYKFAMKCLPLSSGG